MLSFIIRRLLILPLLLLSVTILIFMMLSMLTPYERVSLYVKDIPKRQGAMEGLIEKYGLDDPIPVQYWRWMAGSKDKVTGEIEGGILRGNLGWSKTGKGTVWEVIQRRLPATAELALWSAIPMIGIGIWLDRKSVV
jgi:peptide/nickel transport system permease protein